MPLHHTYRDRLATDPAILGGKPTVKGTRITVARVIEYLAATPSFEELLADYPALTMADAQACLAYAYDQLADETKRADSSTPNPARR